jgi:hypothetical protein
VARSPEDDARLVLAPDARQGQPVEPEPRKAILSTILAGSAPTKRSLAQRWALAAHMRSKKTEVAQKRKLEQVRSVALQSAQTFNSCVLRQNALVVVDKRNILGIRVRSGSASGGARSYLSPQAWLQIAFPDSTSAATSTAQLARQFNVDRETVRRATAVGVEVFMRQQSALMSAIAQHARGQRRLQWVAWSLAWDSTTKLMTLPAHPVLKPSQQRASWHCLVTLSDLICSWEGSPPRPPVVQSAAVVRPPIPLMSTSAPCLDDALFGMSCVQEFTAQVEDLFKQEPGPSALWLTCCPVAPVVRACCVLIHFSDPDCFRF